jgi:hypothetical protein
MAIYQIQLRRQNHGQGHGVWAGTARARQIPVTCQSYASHASGYALLNRAWHQLLALLFAPPLHHLGNNLDKSFRDLGKPD